MKSSINCHAVMHEFEGCRLTSYPDPASPLAKAMRAGLPTAGLSGAPWTIGWGDTGPHVQPGQTITQAEADARFTRRLANEFEPMVVKALKREVPQGVFDALVSIVYNIGPGIVGARDGIITLASGKPSTLMRLVNEGRFVEAADQYPLWNKAGGQVLLGLRRRRAAERALHLGKTSAEAINIGRAIY